MAGLICLPTLVAYYASKHVVISFTKADAMRHGHSQIWINAVCPGAIQTPILGKFSGNNVDGVVQSLGLRREGLPEEVTECLIWLASHKASTLRRQLSVQTEVCSLLQSESGRAKTNSLSKGMIGG
jgi:NAD(P)-dependent dehydrogenase (short-subunit alcohol dehydrogenase family)